MYKKDVRQGYLLGEIGIAKIKKTHIAIYGLGGSGSPIALQLAYLGVGTISIIDPDVVDESNLNRQVLYDREDISLLKIEAAKKRINKIDDKIKVIASRIHTADDLDNLIQNYNVVVDAADDYKFKVMLDRKCRKFNIPMIHTSAVGMRGSVVTFIDNETSYERYFDLPSLNRNLDDVTEQEFEMRRKNLVDILVGDFYPASLVRKVQENEIAWQTLVPAPIIAGGVVVSEIIRIILGLKPMFTPANPYDFNLKFNINEITHY